MSRLVDAPRDFVTKGSLLGVSLFFVTRVFIVDLNFEAEFYFLRAAMARSVRPGISLASVPPLLYIHSRSCLRLNGAQEVEGWATS